MSVYAVRIEVVFWPVNKLEERKLKAFPLIKKRQSETNRLPLISFGGVFLRSKDSTSK